MNAAELVQYLRMLADMDLFLQGLADVIESHEARITALEGVEPPAGVGNGWMMVVLL